MHRHWSQRVTAILFAIWFAIVGLQPGALGACPAHGLSGASAAAGHMSHDMSGGAMHGEHGQPAAPGSHHSHQCSCPDCGCCATIVGAPAAAVIPVPATMLIAAQRHVPTVSVRSVWVDYALPYPTAPPRALSV